MTATTLRIAIIIATTISNTNNNNNNNNNSRGRGQTQRVVCPAGDVQRTRPGGPGEHRLNGPAARPPQNR